MADRILDSLPADYPRGHFIGRAQSPEGPCVIAIEGGTLYDLTGTVSTVAGAVARKQFSGGIALGRVEDGLPDGWALLAPGRLSRGEALRQAAGKAIQLVAGVILFLLIAAFVEAYWSSMTFASPHTKYAVGAGLWLLVLAYFLFAGRRHAPD